ncbi:hypothetical protein PENSPDRAFT_733138, partial [Peniophora sp. CONT]
MVLTCLFKGCVLVTYFLSCTSTVTAQTLAIPQAWRDPISTMDRVSRVKLAYDAATPLATLDISDFGNPDLPRLQYITSVYALLALQDYYSGNSNWTKAGTSQLQAFMAQHGQWGPGAKLYSDRAYWGLALFYSYRTYKQDYLLRYAENAWGSVYDSAFITLNNATSGSGGGRNISFLPPSDSSCHSEAFAGGVFSNGDVLNDTSVNMQSVGSFMALSAYLFEETSTVMYQQAAQLSLDFIIKNLWNGTIVYDNITLSSCTFTPNPFTLNQAWFIEGLAVWANVTRNSTLTTLLETAVPSITTFPAWSLENGVVNETPVHSKRKVADTNSDISSGDQIAKGIYIRGLAEARMRNPGTDLAHYIEAYLTVQFNSLLDNARAPGQSNGFYSESWVGPTPDTVNTSTSTPTRKPTRVDTGAIAGGVGGFAVAAIAVLTTLFLCRRRRRTRPTDLINGNCDPSGTNAVEPFISRPAYNPERSAKSERMNSAYQPPLGASLTSPPASAQDTDHGQNLDQEATGTGIGELPSLIQRLNAVLQGRQGELPPRILGGGDHSDQLSISLKYTAVNLTAWGPTAARDALHEQK